MHNINNAREEYGLSYGLSCIENYIIYALKRKTSYWPQIFVYSYMKFEDVLYSLLQGQTYSRFKGIERVFDVAVRQGLCKLERYATECLPLELMCTGVFAMQVTPEFVMEKYKRKLWRDDHFILVEKEMDNVWNYVNDNPPDRGYLTIEEMKKIYAHRLIKINVNENITYDREKLQETCMQHIIQRGKIIYDISDYPLNEVFRDAVGITKIIIKRMGTLLEFLHKENGISEYYRYLCNCYLKIEYLRMKQGTESEIKKLVDDVRKQDNTYYNILLEQIAKN